MAELAWPARDALLAMRADVYDRLLIEDFLSHWVHQLCAPDVRERRRGDVHLLRQGVPHFCDHLDRLQGTTLAERWSCFECFWITEVKGRKVTGRHLQTAVFLPAVVMRMVAPSMLFLRSYKPVNWIRGLLPAGAPLRGTVDELTRAVDRLQNHVYSEEVKAGALHLGVKMLLTTDSWALLDIREADLIDVKRQTGGCTGADALDAALCSAGVFARTPLRGIARSKLFGVSAHGTDQAD